MKSQIIEQMQNRGLTGAAAEAAFKATVDGLKAAIEAHGSARVPGLGTFRKKHTPARQGRNPRTGETMEFAARDSIAFKHSKASA